MKCGYYFMIRFRDRNSTHALRAEGKKRTSLSRLIVRHAAPPWSLDLLFVFTRIQISFRRCERDGMARGLRWNMQMITSLKIRYDIFILVHDNARPHVAVPVKNYLKTLDWEVLPHLPYSPDTAPSDYHLFQSMAHALSEQRFTSYEDTENWIDLWIAS
ncbi:Mariner Mos1 transposase [Eumeta japonica]|uniref:Mariner Mos1 transposase n=1 Tax=Eumeta variegata TaxID=151549 RepID=A0A4C1TZA2_EUMVA|nr:Mariner Mos1 transposase [Eumeta japonica]